MCDGIIRIGSVIKVPVLFIILRITTAFTKWYNQWNMGIQYPNLFGRQHGPGVMKKAYQHIRQFILRNEKIKYFYNHNLKAN